MTAQATRNIDGVTTAKLIRAALKAKFPAVKFSVRLDRYAGGSSIDVRWEDGPTAQDVEAVAKFFNGSSFDGMTDSTNYHDRTLTAEGLAVPAGTAEGELVHFSVSFIFCYRTITKAFEASFRSAFTAMTERERLKLMDATKAWQAAHPIPQSWGYDAELVDFGASAPDVFRAMMRGVPA